MPHNTSPVLDLPAPLSVDRRLQLGHEQPHGNPSSLASAMGSPEPIRPRLLGMEPATFRCPICGGTATATAHESVLGVLSLACDGPECDPEELLERCRAAAPDVFVWRGDLLYTIPADIEAALDARARDGSYTAGHQTAMSILDKLRCCSDAHHLYRYTSPWGEGAAMLSFHFHSVQDGAQTKTVRNFYAAVDMNGALEIVCGQPEGQRPLFGLADLAARPDARIIHTEGEKAAVVAGARWASMIAVTSMSGAANAGLSDFTAVRGRDIVIWPDNDDSGAEYAQDVAAHALAASARSVRIVRLPTGLPPKWDLADPLPDGVTNDDIKHALDDAPEVSWEAVKGRLKPVFPRTHGPTAYPPNLLLSEDVLRFLMAHPQGIDIGVRKEWMRTAIVLHEHGEPGYAVFLAISRSHASFGGEGPCRTLWDSIKDDKPDGARLTIGTYIAMAKALGWRGKRQPVARVEALDDVAGTGGAPEDELVPNGRGNRRRDAAVVALEQADDAGDQRFLDSNDRPHVRFRRPAPEGGECWATARIESSLYRGVVKRRFYLEQGKVLPKEQLNAAIELLEAEAMESGDRRDVHLRVAETPGCTYVDLGRGDGRAIAVTAEGWQVIVDPPVNFVTGSRGALPMPETGGTLDLFGQHFNLSPEDILRAVGFLVGTFHTGQAYMMLMITGEAGSAKSNLGDKLLALSDPPRGSHRDQRHGMSTDERNLHVQASRCHVMFFDNISSFSGDVADQLCRLSTGGASGSRQHHTMDEEHQFAVLCPVVFTCISVPSSRTDLLSRSLRVDAQRIVHRRSEEAVWREFNADAGKMLGFLMDAVSAALRNKADVEARVEAKDLRLPRMGDFGQFVEGAAEVLGLPPGGFATLLNDEQAAVQAQAVQDNPLVEGLLRYFSGPDAAPLDVTAAELLQILTEQVPDADLPPKGRIKDALNRVMQGLRDNGVDVEFLGKANHDKAHRFRVRTNGAFEPVSVPPRRSYGTPF